ncbi:MAG: hypothetical protein KatS3mg057_1148 [Herpetosiphonaceae bacterium]|nr:MAG: hypothetical protein KatS3mg057_1148 [Herpetosiphonaceae bacterium]
MPELVRGRPLLQVEFLPSLGLDVLATMSLVTLVHDFEGLREWLVEASSAMSPRLRHDLELVWRFAGYGAAIVEELGGALLTESDAPGHEDFEALHEGLSRISGEQARAMIMAVIRKSAARQEIALEQPVEVIVEDRAALEQLLTQLGTPVALDEAIRLVYNPDIWHQLLCSSTRRFWERFYRAEYERNQPQRERNALYHRRHAPRPNFTDLFMAVTGRMLPQYIVPRLQEVEKARFVPSQHLGPYVAFLFNGPLMTVFYNSRTTPVEDEDLEERIQSLYLPLEALADKTRLQILALLRGRELYAQEIVDRLHIHQSAVSRHLKLMETAGVLSVRRDKGSKYYSINTEVIQQLRRQLEELL